MDTAGCGVAPGERSDSHDASEEDDEGREHGDEVKSVCHCCLLSHGLIATKIKKEYKRGE